MSHNKTIRQALGRYPVHPFPARMAPGIALDALGNGSHSLRVLDPMMGSGTVLAVARSRGHRAIGVDLDPLAVLLAKVWTTTIDPVFVRQQAKEALTRARATFYSIPVSAAYPTNADVQTKEFTRYWFDGYARRQLASLAEVIRNVRNRDARDVLWCGFSRLIITKRAGASLAMDLSHSRPHRVFDRAPVKPFNRFGAAMEAVISNCPQRRFGRVGPAPVVKQGDARQLPVATSSIDLVLTSPPYLNAIDYMRCSKFSLVWMGYRIRDMRTIRSSAVGAEISSNVAMSDREIRHLIGDLKLSPQLNARDNALLCQYIFDMRKAVSETARVLAPRGRAVYVIGENTLRGTYIRNSEIIIAVAALAGLSLTARCSRPLPPNRRYLPPPVLTRPSASLNNRMRHEIILEFKKPSE